MAGQRDLRTGRFGHAYQRGLLAIDALIFGGFILIIISIGSWVLGEVSKSNQARAAGNYLVQYASAVRLALANESFTQLNTRLGGAAQTTADWLKDAGCTGGTATDPYMPNCGFPDTDPAFGYTVRTTISEDGVGSGIPQATIEFVAEAIEDQPNLLNQVIRRVQMGDPAINGNLSTTFVTSSLTDTGGANTNPGTVEIIATRSDAEPYIRVDGSNDWAPGADQNVNTATFKNVGSISSAGNTPGDGSIEMTSFIDADDPTNYFLDPNGTSQLATVSAEAIIGDPTIDLDGDGVGDQRLSTLVVQQKGVVTSGETVPKPVCAAADTQYIQGWVVGLIATDTTDGSGRYADPKNMKGFNVYAADNGGTWTVAAKAIIDDDASPTPNEVDPPGALALIGYMTGCS